MASNKKKYIYQCVLLRFNYYRQRVNPVAIFIINKCIYIKIFKNHAKKRMSERFRESNIVRKK